jgi:hypothetical protein
MLVKYYEPPRLEDLPPDSPQFYWAAYRAAVANAMIAERFLYACTGKRYLWPGTRIVTEEPRPEWVVETLLQLCRILDGTQQLLWTALEDFIRVVPDTVEDRGIRAACWHLWCWECSSEIRERIVALDEGAHGTEHLQATRGLDEKWLQEQLPATMATAALDPPLDTHGILMRLRCEEVRVIDHATRKLDHMRMCREAVQTSSLEIPPIPGANSAPILSLNGPPATTPSSQETSAEPLKPLSLEGQILQLRPRAPLLARLAHLMETREEASTEQVREVVYCGDGRKESERNEGPLKQLIYRTNGALRELAYPRQLRYTARLVFWEPT